YSKRPETLILLAWIIHSFLPIIRHSPNFKSIGELNTIEIKAIYEVKIDSPQFYRFGSPVFPHALYNQDFIIGLIYLECKGQRPYKSTSFFPGGKYGVLGKSHLAFRLS